MYWCQREKERKKKSGGTTPRADFSEERRKQRKFKFVWVWRNVKIIFCANIPSALVVSVGTPRILTMCGGTPVEFLAWSETPRTAVSTMACRKINKSQCEMLVVCVRVAVELWKDKSRKVGDDRNSVRCKEGAIKMSWKASTAINWARLDKRLRCWQLWRLDHIWRSEKNLEKQCINEPLWRKYVDGGKARGLALAGINGVLAVSGWYLRCTVGISRVVSGRSRKLVIVIARGRLLVRWSKIRQQPTDCLET